MSGETSQSYRSLWNRTDVFDSYDETRSLVEPALRQIVGRVLIDNFNPGATILEIGAGGGALRRYAGETGDYYNWLESDHTTAFLQLPRAIDTAKLAIALPDLPVRANSLDGIISLGVLDTLSNQDLSGTAKAAAASLAANGKIVHLLDMLPDLEVEIKNARAEGLFPLVYTSDENETLGLHYINLKNLPRRISRLPVQTSVINTFLAIVNDPERNIFKVNRTGILPYLGSIAAEYGMVVKSVPSWFSMLGLKLAKLFEDQGLVIKQNNTVKSGAVISDKVLPPAFKHKGATHIVRNEGSIKFIKEDNCLLLPGEVNVRASMQVVIAEKT